MNCGAKCPFILYELNKSCLLVAPAATLCIKLDIQWRTKMLIPVLRVVRRYRTFLIFPWICQAISILKGYRTLSGIIILFVLACPTRGSQLKWPFWRRLALTHQSILDPSLHFHSTLKSSLQLNIRANICLISAFQKPTAWYTFYWRRTHFSVLHFMLKTF